MQWRSVPTTDDGTVYSRRDMIDAMIRTLKNGIREASCPDEASVLRIVIKILISS